MIQKIEVIIIQTTKKVVMAQRQSQIIKLLKAIVPNITSMHPKKITKHPNPIKTLI